MVVRAGGRTGRNVLAADFFADGGAGDVHEGVVAFEGLFWGVLSCGGQSGRGDSVDPTFQGDDLFGEQPELGSTLG